MANMEIEHLERAVGWKYDLPAPGEPVDSRSCLERLEPAPNYVDAVYLELPRSSLKVRGIGRIFGSAALVISIPGLMFFIYDLMSSSWNYDSPIILFGTIGIFVACWATIPMIRMDIEFPRSEPIRFNRKRRKVYFYQYHYDPFNPLGLRGWGVKPVVYDWDDLVVEACSIYAPMGYGGLMERVFIRVCKPGTDKVIDRLFFTYDIDQGKDYWAVARLFMQQGPEALPDFVNPPWDWNSDDGLSPMHCLAPKVQWPADIDRESRTAPTET
ncbi:DUF6708 domain-containing protein [Pseudomonas sp. NPDC090233]|uniref:DUF6708 domain-containing protein n=1 Tax=Pseudomonas sp. NPDC090233 TaxID=3364479 RepID=UPI00383A6366